MKKTFICAAVVGALALAAGIDSSYAQRGGGGGGDGGGGNAVGGHGGGGGNAVGGHGGGASGWHGGNNGWRGGSGNWNRGSWNRGFHGRSSFGIVIGAPFAYWGAGYYPYYYPYYYDPYYYPAYGGAVYADPIYDSPPVYGESEPPVYTQQDPGYRYYCPNPPGYYPSVQSCSQGWLKVVPDPATQYAPPAYQPRQ